MVVVPAINSAAAARKAIAGMARGSEECRENNRGESRTKHARIPPYSERESCEAKAQTPVLRRRDFGC